MRVLGRRLARLESLVPSATDLDQEMSIAALVLLRPDELAVMETIARRPEPRALADDEVAVLARYEANLAAIERTQRNDGPRRATTASAMVARGIQ